MSLSESQLYAISITERVCSAVSLAATSVIIVSFLCSTSFRKLINGLVFYASWGNIMANLATAISQSGIRAGLERPLYHFQAFLIQWFNDLCLPMRYGLLHMACNVYLTFFRKYDSDQLRRVEWKYFALCYGLPFVPAFVYFLIKTKARGRIYETAVLWCWVAPSWDFLRIAVFYGPVWFVIFLTVAIYARTGSVIYKRRRQLLQIGMLGSKADCENSNVPAFSKTTEIRITRAATAPNELSRSVAEASSPIAPNFPPSCSSPYSVTIEGGKSSSVPLKPLRPEPSDPLLQRRAMMAEANFAAWAYTKYAMLFFIALVITWVPSTINRVYSLVFPQSFSFALNYLSSFVLPLQGFWNSIIYISISWPAFRSASDKSLRAGLGRHHDTGVDNNIARASSYNRDGSTHRLTA